MPQPKHRWRAALGLTAAACGAGLIVSGAALVSVPLGMFTGGVCLLYIARAVAA